MNINRAPFATVADKGYPACHIATVNEDGWHRMIYRTDGQWYVACLELQNSKGARTTCKREDAVRLSSEDIVRDYERELA